MQLGSATLYASKPRRRAVARTPREMLVQLIKRSGKSQSEVARELGFASTAGFNRYTREQTQGSRPIPADIVNRLLPLLKGKGHPAITSDEVLALSGLTALPSPAPAALITPTVFLRIRYRVESGTFFKLENTKPIGTSFIGSVPDYPAANQFVASLNGAYIHCVDPEQVAPEMRITKRSLVAVPYDKTGLVELRVVGAGEKVQGKALGVVIGLYVRE